MLFNITSLLIYIKTFPNCFLLNSYRFASPLYIIKTQNCHSSYRTMAILNLISQIKKKKREMVHRMEHLNINYHF